jgi:hypothetical protein
MLKAKSKETLDLMLAKPELRPYEAYLITHPKASKRTAQQNMFKLMKTTECQLYIKDHIELAREVTVDVMKLARDKTDKVGWQRLASDVAERILDRELGKPVVRQEIKSTRITISLGNLTETDK